MHPKTLITSFTTWKPEQPSNASDDLLSLILERQGFPEHVHCLRQLPVDFQIAPQLVLQQIQRLQPQLIICCGMAESRTYLSLESRAVYQDQVRVSEVNLELLTTGLAETQISYDAGNFVCNYLYYRVLEYLVSQPSQDPAIALFVHVPILDLKNQSGIVTDFLLLLNRLGVGLQAS